MINELTRVRRKPDRARYDTDSVFAVLDEAPFCHVGTVRDGRPVVTPMAHARLGDVLVLHGSRAAGLFWSARGGSPVCVTATIYDGLVLGRAARTHSMNYRSVMVHGYATEVGEPADGLRAVVEHITPGRWADVRAPSQDDLRETALWSVPIEAASVKVRTGSVLDDAADLGLPGWAGHIPARISYGEPVPAAGVLAPVPGYALSLS